MKKLEKRKEETTNDIQYSNNNQSKVNLCRCRYRYLARSHTELTS